MSSGSGTSWGFGLGLESPPGRSSTGSWSNSPLNRASPQREGPMLSSPPSGGSRAISRIFAHHNCAGFTYLLEFGATTQRPAYLLSRSRVRASPPLFQYKPLFSCLATALTEMYLRAFLAKFQRREVPRVRLTLVRPAQPSL